MYYDNKYETYLSTNIDELNENLNKFLKDNIDIENKLKQSNEEKQNLLKKINELESAINEMNLYIGELEKCNEQYRLCLNNFYNEKNNNLINIKIFDNINNDKSLNETMILQRLKSSNVQKSILNIEEDEELIKLKKEKDELDKKIIEYNGEIKKINEKNKMIINEKNELKLKINNLIIENNGLKVIQEKLKNENSLLNEKISNLNTQLQIKISEIENLSIKINSMIKASDEKFKQTTEIFEKNIKELRAENRSWRKALDKYIGKKREDEDLNEGNEDINKKNNVDIDEQKEEKKYKKK